MCPRSLTNSLSHPVLSQEPMVTGGGIQEFCPQPSAWPSPLLSWPLSSLGQGCGDGSHLGKPIAKTPVMCSPVAEVGSWWWQMSPHLCLLFPCEQQLALPCGEPRIKLTQPAVLSCVPQGHTWVLVSGPSVFIASLCGCSPASQLT